MKTPTTRRSTLFLICFLSATAVNGLLADEPDILQALEKASQQLTSDSYRLQYKYQQGESIQHDIEQLTTIETTIDKNNQTTKLRTKTRRAFDVQEVTAEGNMKFAHRILRVEMWNEVTGRQPVRYDSTTDDEPPAEFGSIDENIGEPISVITLSPSGQIVDRTDRVQHLNAGLSGIAIPLPEQAIKLGDTWAIPSDVKVQLEDKRIKVIKTRELYELVKVETGVATISVKTQILTPIDDARVRAQIIQRISKGDIRFDIDAGRLLSKRLDFDETVLGFNGAESKMTYLARFTETLDPATVASKPSLPTAK